MEEKQKKDLKGGGKISPRALPNNETLQKMLPMTPEEGPPLPRMLGIKWPWKK